MKFTRLSHTAFQVRDLETSLNFYRDGLGFTEKFRLSYGDVLDDLDDAARAAVPAEHLVFLEGHREDTWLIYLEIAPMQFLEIFPAAVAEMFPDPAAGDGQAHFCLEVEDLEAAYAELTARGLEPLTPIAVGLDRTKQFWMSDPDGHRFELMQFGPASLQIAGRG